jgi:thymidylate kinase
MDFHDILTNINTNINPFMSNLSFMEAFIIGALIASVIILLPVIIYIVFFDVTVDTNIHYFAFYDQKKDKITYNKSNKFRRTFNKIYMNYSLKKEITNTIDAFNDHSNNFTINNIPRSLRLVFTGQNGIGKTTLIETIASEYNYGLINFPRDNYSESMIHKFFKDINTIFPERVIVFFNKIDFKDLYATNKRLYNLIAEFVIKTDRDNLFIFTFNNLDDIPPEFNTTYHVHQQYMMEVHINNIMDMISDNIDDDDDIELSKIKNKLLSYNHKLTPGYIIPYLMFNNNFQKSLDQFLINH